MEKQDQARWNNIKERRHQYVHDRCLVVVFMDSRYKVKDELVIKSFARSVAQFYPPYIVNKFTITVIKRSCDVYEVEDYQNCQQHRPLFSKIASLVWRLPS